MKYSPDAIRVAAEMSAKYMHDRFLPDKAIDVLDEAGAALKLKSTSGRRSSFARGTSKLWLREWLKFPPRR